MLLGCLIGAAVFAQLPQGKSPTLRQAIAAAGVPASGAPATNLDSAITGWSWGCDADNYTVGYFVENAGADPSLFGRLWIDRYDAGKKKWSETSLQPPVGRTGQAESNVVVTLFWDGFDLYAELEGVSGDVRTLQFAHDLTYRRQFYGKTLAGLTGGALLYGVDSDDPAHNDSLYSVFDPDSGVSRSIFPVDPKPAVELRGEQLAHSQYVGCGAAWFKQHAWPVDAKHPFESIITARADLQTDSLAFGISYGAFGCEVVTAPAPEVDAIYVYIHPADPKRMRVVEISVPDVKQVTAAKLDALLTKQSLSTLFSK